MLRSVVRMFHSVVGMLRSIVRLCWWRFFGTHIVCFLFPFKLPLGTRTGLNHTLVTPTLLLLSLVLSVNFLSLFTPLTPCWFLIFLVYFNLPLSQSTPCCYYVSNFLVLSLVICCYLCFCLVCIFLAPLILCSGLCLLCLFLFSCVSLLVVAVFGLSVVSVVHQFAVRFYLSVYVFIFSVSSSGNLSFFFLSTFYCLSFPLFLSERSFFFFFQGCCFVVVWFFGFVYSRP